MKIALSSSQLLAGMALVSKAIPAKTTNAILENFLCEVSGTTLTLTASDGEVTLKTSIEADHVEEEGRIAIGAKQFMELLKELPDQPITLKTLDEGSFECVWISGNSTLPYVNADDFPAIATTDESAITVTMPGATLLDGIASTVYATADDEIRPVLNAILFDIDVESTTLVASDTHKLICYTTNEVKTQEKSSFILLKKPANILKNIVSRDDEVTVQFDGKTAVFTFGVTTASCRLINGKYPNYRSVIPTGNSSILKIDRVQLLNIVRRVAVCANKASNQIRVDLSEGKIEISAQDTGFNTKAFEKCACSYEGDELSIGFKSTFLIEILSNMGCNELEIKFADARKPALIKPVDEEMAKEKACGILMPIMF
ncbi:MAG: DNA polymerase III subunit beta [Bacteroidales bacterium]|nr:DNA polymerase III subunit beta [Bacteroidales bacterium]